MGPIRGSTGGTRAQVVRYLYTATDKNYEKTVKRLLIFNF